jgi:hypothetical protein
VPKIQYSQIRLSQPSLSLISLCNGIIDEYTAQGFRLTLRQLYYQLVARDKLANRQTEYKRLGSVVNDGRLAGLIDWLAIEDRTRNLRQLPHWEDPAKLIQICSEQFRTDVWADQKHRIEVWIEKDALLGVIEGVCEELDVPFFSCRGYTSQSEMWSAAMRLYRYVKAGQTPVILHFGDHDPSGKDMTRDIRERLELFMGGVEIKRLALNMDQVERYSPPPNPAKTTDSRYAGYIAEFGEDSWELDALEPAVIADLIRKAVESLTEGALMKRSKEADRQHRKNIGLVAERWYDVLDGLQE